MTDNSGNFTDPLAESVEELKARLEAMKRLEEIEMQNRNKKNERKNKDSIIDGSFLSVVFGMVLFLLLFVTIYAFYNLYHAILKKFPSKEHTEL